VRTSFNHPIPNFSTSPHNRTVVADALSELQCLTLAYLDAIRTAKNGILLPDSTPSYLKDVAYLLNLADSLTLIHRHIWIAHILTIGAHMAGIIEARSIWFTTVGVISV
jgi:hypothetical protein